MPMALPGKHTTECIKMIKTIPYIDFSTPIQCPRPSILSTEIDTSPGPEEAKYSPVYA
jgi:hypothetical protein